MYDESRGWTSIKEDMAQVLDEIALGVCEEEDPEDDTGEEADIEETGEEADIEETGEEADTDEWETDTEVSEDESDWPTMSKEEWNRLSKQISDPSDVFVLCAELGVDVPDWFESEYYDFDPFCDDY